MDNKKQNEPSLLKYDNNQLESIFAEVDRLIKDDLNKDDNGTRIAQLLVKLVSYCKVLREKSENHEKTLAEISVQDEKIKKMDQTNSDFKRTIRELQNKLKECQELNKRHNKESDKTKIEHSEEVQELKDQIRVLKKENDETKKKAGSYNIKAQNLGGTQTVNVQPLGKCSDDTCKKDLADKERALEKKTAESDRCKLELQNKNRALKEATTENEKNKRELEQMTKALQEKTVENDDWKKKYGESMNANGHLQERNNQSQTEIQNLKNVITDLQEQLNTVTYTPTAEQE